MLVASDVMALPKSRPMRNYSNLKERDRTRAAPISPRGTNISSPPSHNVTSLNKSFSISYLLSFWHLAYLIFISLFFFALFKFSFPSVSTPIQNPQPGSPLFIFLINLCKYFQRLKFNHYCYS